MPAPNPTMESDSHLLVPFAAASAPECRALLPDMPLPSLSALLGELSQGTRLDGDDLELTPPHERVLAHALGLGLHDDGTIPWAAARSDTPHLPQAWFTPCHFQVGMDHVSLQGPDSLALDPRQSRALFDALAPYCQEDGIQLQFESAHRWRALGEPLRHLVCASLDRVTGRSVADWTPQDQPDNAGAQLVKRLQSEAQMLFYSHPVNDEREASRQPIINGFWVHGAGVLDHPTIPGGTVPTVCDMLRLPALQGNWAAWRQAWDQLERDHMTPLLAKAQRGQSVSLTLCGERHAITWHNATPKGLLTRLGQTLRGKTPAWKQLDTL